MTEKEARHEINQFVLRRNEVYLSLLEEIQTGQITTIKDMEIALIAKCKAGFESLEC